MITALRYHLLIAVSITLAHPFICQCASEKTQEAPTSHALISQTINSEKKSSSPEHKATSVAEISNEMLYLNYADTPLSSIVEDILKLKNLNYISSNKDLELVKVTMQTSEPVSIQGAFDVMLTLLNINGFAFDDVDGVVRIVKKDTVKREPLPVFFNLNPDELPDTTTVGRFIQVFLNIKFDQAITILQQLLGDTASLQPVPSLNAVIVVGPAINLKHALRVIAELDKNGLREVLEIIPLKNTMASDVEKLLKEIIDIKDDSHNPMRYLSKPQQDAAYFSKETRIIANTRNNTLVLMGTQENVEKIRNFITTSIDVVPAAPDSRLHVKELKYVDCASIQKLLTDIIKKPSGIPGSVSGSVVFFEDTTIAAEQSQTTPAAPGDGSLPPIGSGNRLLIACNNEDWERLNDFIDQLDKPFPTVAIEVLFVENQVNDDREINAQIRDKKPGTIGRHIDMQAQNMTTFPVNSSGAAISFPPDSNLRSDMIIPPFQQSSAGVKGAYFTVGCVDNIWGAVQTVLSSDTLVVVGQPFMVTNHNQETNLKIEQTLRVPGPLDANSVTPAVKVEDMKAAFNLKMTPRVSANGDIDLAIFFSLDNFTEITTNGFPNIFTRHLITRTNLHNGEVLVLGGGRSKKVTESRTKTPVLGDIPFIGNLFQGRQQFVTIDDLYVFIRPTVIKPRFDGNPESYTQLKLDYARMRLDDSTALRSTADPIQRWYFSTERAGIPSEKNQLDDFATLKCQPKAVAIAQDMYYRTPTAATVQKYENLVERVKEQPTPDKSNNPLQNNPLSRTNSIKKDRKKRRLQRKQALGAE